MTLSLSGAFFVFCLLLIVVTVSVICVQIAVVYLGRRLRLMLRKKLLRYIKHVNTNRRRFNEELSLVKNLLASHPLLIEGESKEALRKMAVSFAVDGVILSRLLPYARMLRVELVKNEKASLWVLLCAYLRLYFLPCLISCRGESGRARLEDQVIGKLKPQVLNILPDLLSQENVDQNCFDDLFSVLFWTPRFDSSLFPRFYAPLAKIADDCMYTRRVSRAGWWSFHVELSRELFDKVAAFLADETFLEGLGTLETLRFSRSNIVRADIEIVRHLVMALLCMKAKDSAFERDLLGKFFLLRDFEARLQELHAYFYQDEKGIVPLVAQIDILLKELAEIGCEVQEAEAERNRLTMGALLSATGKFFPNGKSLFDLQIIPEYLNIFLDILKAKGADKVEERDVYVDRLENLLKRLSCHSSLIAKVKDLDRRYSDALSACALLKEELPHELGIAGMEFPPESDPEQWLLTVPNCLVSAANNLKIAADSPSLAAAERRLIAAEVTIEAAEACCYTELFGDGKLRQFDDKVIALFNDLREARGKVAHLISQVHLHSKTFRLSGAFAIMEEGSEECLILSMRKIGNNLLFQLKIGQGLLDEANKAWMEGRPFEALSIVPGVQNCLTIIEALVQVTHERLSETETAMQELRNQIGSVKDFNLMEMFEWFAIPQRQRRCKEMRQRYRHLRRATRRPKGLDPNALNEDFERFKEEVHELLAELVEDARAHSEAEKAIRTLEQSHKKLLEYLNAEQKKELNPVQKEILHQAGKAVNEPVNRLVHEFEVADHANWGDIAGSAVNLTRLVKGTLCDVPDRIAQEAAY